MTMTGFVAVIAIVATGCGTTATIHYERGQTEGKIVSVTPTRLHVIEEKSGEEEAIAFEDVRDIDHPGNVHAVVGAVLVPIGVVNAMVGLPGCSGRQSGVAYCAGALIPLAAGIGMFSWGMMVWTYSKKNASRERPQQALELVPSWSPVSPRTGAVALVLRY